MYFKLFVQKFFSSLKQQGLKKSVDVWKSIHGIYKPAFPKVWEKLWNEINKILAVKKKVDIILKIKYHLISCVQILIKLKFLKFSP